MRRPHLIGLRPYRLDLHQRTPVDPRTIPGRLPPLPPALDHLRPKRKNPALHRLHRMNRAPIRPQKRTLRIPGNAQPNPILRPVAVCPLELRRRQPQMRSNPNHIRFAQINKPPLLTTLRASRLALESKSRRHALLCNDAPPATAPRRVHLIRHWFLGVIDEELRWPFFPL